MPLHDLSRSLIVDGRLEQGSSAQAPVILPLAEWLEQANTDSPDPSVAPCLASDTELTSSLYASLQGCALIAVAFPVFTDGRGYTLGRLLRQRYGFRGELRAVGDIMVDQLEALRRCGFNAMALREDQDMAVALRALHTFSAHYQSDATESRSLLEKRSGKPSENRSSTHGQSA